MNAENASLMTLPIRSYLSSDSLKYGIGRSLHCGLFVLCDRQHDGDYHSTVFTPVNDALFVFVSAACIVTEQIGQTFGGTWGLVGCSMQPSPFQKTYADLS
jgi:hypothetical protein